MKNKISFILLTSFLIGILLISLASAFSFCVGGFSQGNPTDRNNTEMRTFTTSLNSAIQNKDFNTWKSLIESQLTQENFNQMVLESNHSQEPRPDMNRSNLNINKTHPDFKKDKLNKGENKNKKSWWKFW